MKKLLSFRVASMLCAVLMVSNVTYAQITTPRSASPAAEVSQTIGISEVTINYSRPAVREREIWGSLVPYGWTRFGFGSGNEAPWRAGANENTVITFSHDAQVESKPIKAGSYGLFAVVNEDNSAQVIFSENTDSWGSFWYDPAEDVLRVDVTSREIPHTERLTYDFINMDNNSAEAVLNWEKKQIPFKISFDVHEIVIANAENELRGVAGFRWQGPFSAANYCMTNNVQIEKGLEWIDRAIAQNRDFNTLRVKAGLLSLKGKDDEAKDLMEEAIVDANEFQLNIYGYQLLNQKKFDRAIRILELNAERHPESANCFDSLGEAYYMAGDKKNAIKNFKKSLSMDPPANVRANSENYLKKMGAL